MIRNAGRLRGNPRMAMVYRTLDRFTPEKRAAMVEQADGFLAGLA